MMPQNSRQFVLATRNRDKIREMHETLAELPVQILTLDDFPDAPEVVEDGETLEDNARKKALAVHQHTGLPALADDTGLYVFALGGAPGVRSSRYAGEQASYQDNVNKLLAEMREIPPANRSAEFRTVLAFAEAGKIHLIAGACAGSIALAPRGQSGFGYDPVFMPAGSGRTFAEMTLAEKNAISHRGDAVMQFCELLKQRWFA
jgi:XTP/dITP diphosphohydrolase